MPEMPMPLGVARNVRLFVDGTTVPAVNSARSRKNRPLIGMSTIFLLSTTSPNADDSVCTTDDAASTLTMAEEHPHGKTTSYVPTFPHCYTNCACRSCRNAGESA